jgi:hypothetical protein
VVGEPKKLIRSKPEKTENQKHRKKKMKEEIHEVPIADLQEDFYVRTGLNDAHIEHLATLIRSETFPDPIEVDPRNMSIISGRHRKAAYLREGYETIFCVYKRPRSRASAIIMAFADNTGGPLPPNNQDLRHTMELLIGERLNREQIVERLYKATKYPERMLRNLLKETRDILSKRKVRKGVELVASKGLSVASAAKEAGVSEKALSTKISGNSGMVEESPIDITKIKRAMSFGYRGVARKVTNSTEQLFEAFADGDISESAVRGFLASQGKLIKRHLQANQEAIRRFDKKRGKKDSRLSKSMQLEKKPSNSKSTGAKALEAMNLKV